MPISGWKVGAFPPPTPQIRTRKDQLKMGMAEATHLMYSMWKRVGGFGSGTLSQWESRGRSGGCDSTLSIKQKGHVVQEKHSCCWHGGQTELFPRALIKGRLCSYMNHRLISFLTLSTAISFMGLLPLTSLREAGRRHRCPSSIAACCEGV